MTKKALAGRAWVTIALNVALSALACVVLLLIPFTDGIQAGRNNIGAYLIAILFWLGSLGSIVSSFLTRRTLRGARELLIQKGYVDKKHRVGIISFSKKTPNVILYVAIGIGLIFIITDIIFGYVHELIMFPIISLTLLSFALHCVIDGKYYKVYKIIREMENNGKNRKSK